MFDTILQTLIEEYRLDGHEVVEQEGVFFARLVLIDGKGVTVVTDQNLTRIADAAEARLASLKANPPPESHLERQNYNCPCGHPSQCDDSCLPPAPQKNLRGAALADVAAERRRQIDVEGWTPRHDDAHSDGEMARAASCYAYHGSWSASDRQKMANRFPQNWPWERAWWKPTDARRDLVKAAALIIAEIERLDRTSEAQP